jgi:hypothetical protein
VVPACVGVLHHSPSRRACPGARCMLTNRREERGVSRGFSLEMEMAGLGDFTTPRHDASASACGDAPQSSKGTEAIRCSSWYSSRSRAMAATLRLSDKTWRLSSAASSMPIAS